MKNRLTIGFSAVYTRALLVFAFQGPMASQRTPQEVPNLGDLEVAVLEHLWSSTGATAKSVHKVVGVSRGISLNTVQSALERLYRKGLLDREKRGHSFIYSPVVDREQLIGRLIGDVIDRFGADPSLALAAFVETSDDVDLEEFRRLEDRLRRRKGAGDR